MAISIYPETVPVVIQDPVAETSIRLISFPPEITQIREYIHETVTYDESDNLVIDYLRDIRYESLTKLQLDTANRELTIPTINWENKTPQPFSTGASAVIVAGDYLYMMRGGTKEFWRYDIINDVWTRMQDRTNAVGNYPGICYDGSNFIYVYSGDSTTYTFERYNISTNSWTVLSNTGTSGQSLGYDPAGYIYMHQGNNSIGSYKYTIATNSWTNISWVGPNINYLQSTMPFLIKDGKKYFFLLYSTNMNGFRAYRPDINAWTELAVLPVNANYRPILVNYFSNYLLCIPSNNISYMYIYDFLNNKWVQVKNVQNKSFNYTNSGGVWNDYLYASNTGQELVRLKIFNLGTYDIEYISKRRLLLDKYKTVYLLVGNMMYYINNNYIPQCQITFDDGTTWIDVPLLGTDLFTAPSTSVPVENYYYITNLTTDVGAKFKIKLTGSVSYNNLIELQIPIYKNIIGAFFLK